MRHPTPPVNLSEGQVGRHGAEARMRNSPIAACCPSASKAISTRHHDGAGARSAEGLGPSIGVHFHGSRSMPTQPGTADLGWRAPDFALKDTLGRIVSLRDGKGRN